MPPFHCIMIDWSWVFNAVIAILQSYESKVFNIFTIDDDDKHWDFKSRLPEKSVVHWLIERKVIYGDMQDNYVDKHLS